MNIWKPDRKTPGFYRRKKTRVDQQADELISSNQTLKAENAELKAQMVQVLERLDALETKKTAKKKTKK